MRRILVEQCPSQTAAQARRRSAPRGSGASRHRCAAIQRDELLALDEALTKLAAAKTRSAAKLVKLRFFAGLTMPRSRRGPGHFATNGRTPSGPMPAPGCTQELTDRLTVIASQTSDFLGVVWRRLLALLIGARFGEEVARWIEASDLLRRALDIESPAGAGGLPGRGLRRTTPTCASGSRPCSQRTRQPAASWQAPSAGARRQPSISRRRKVPARRSARTSCCSRSAKAAWAPSTWPSRPQPVQRKVALKVIKPGMDSRQVIARFEAERQALAMMDHVNIARVFDGGDHGEPAGRTSSWSWSTACRSPSTATTTT